MSRAEHTPIPNRLTKGSRFRARRFIPTAAIAVLTTLSAACSEGRVSAAAPPVTPTTSSWTSPRSAQYGEPRIPISVPLPSAVEPTPTLTAELTS